MTFDRRTFLRRAGIGAAGAGALAAGITPAVGAQSSIPAGLGALPGAGVGVPVGTLLDYASGPPSVASIRAAGHMGAVRVTVQNLTVVKVDTENNLIAVKGAVPGTKGTIVTLANSVKA